jgi:hypothetical protein
VTEADLKRVGSQPRLKDRFASWALKSEITVGQDLSSVTDTKSKGMYVGTEVERVLITSTEVISGR